ncbi:MAG: glycosyltransferase family 39 protein [Nitrospirae bacterium]|nr:glycosyltransferase family 39 protein [Nitrospirota bacterium]
MGDGRKDLTPEDRTLRCVTPWIFLAIIILFVVFVRVRLLEFPLERDEGEYAYMGQLILQGIPPYSGAYNMKFPGTYLMYALMMAVFGQTVKGIHLGFMIVNCASIFLAFLLARRIVNSVPAALAAGTYALLSLNSSVFGFAAHATHFVVLPALAGTLVMLHAVEKEKLSLYFLSGALFGASFIMKQPGIFFLLFGASYLLSRRLSSRPAHWTKTFFLELGALFLGASLPLLITLLWLYASGVFSRFWFWTVVYASRYGSQIPLSAAFFSFRRNFPSVTDGFLLLWILSAFGLAATFFHRRLKVSRPFVLLFVLWSFLSVCPGFYFREHYFVTLLPAVSLLVGVFFDFLSSRGFASLKPEILNYAGLAIFTTAALAGGIVQEGYLFTDAPSRLSRAVYGPNPFPESLPIAEFIKSRSGATDRIAVLGSEPQIYFYSGRSSATGYIYTYSLMENHEYALTMQKEMAREIEASHPKFLVLVSIFTSWLIRPESEKFIFEWSDDYLRRNYLLVGVADIVSPQTTIYRWDAAARNYPVQSSSYVLLFERNS